MIDLREVLAGKWAAGTRPADLYAQHIAAKPKGYVDAIVAGLGSNEKRVQGGCAELASRLSADHPDLLYPQVDLFVRNLKAKAPILRWEAVCTIGNLAAVDSREVIGAHVPMLVAMLADKSIVLQGHAVRALAKLAARYPARAPKILDALLAAEAHFPGGRVGYLIEATEAFVVHPRLAAKIRRFLQPQIRSARGPVARKATRALKALARARGD